MITKKLCRKSYIIDYVCDTCKKGKMRPIKTIIYPTTKWLSKCTNCLEEVALDSPYPHETFVMRIK